MSVISLTWSQVNAWRVAQHALAHRLPSQELVSAARRTVGIQAQVMSAAELALWARLDGLAQQDVQSALWQARTLVKTWAMRATLHLLPAADLPLYVAARSVYEARNWSNYFDFFGISPAQSEAFLAAVPQVLGSQPVTREQLAAAVADYTSVPDLEQKLLGSSWGSLWKPSAWRGDLCFGPNQGRSVTFVRPAAWFGGWQAVEPYPALQEIARRFLQAYGPARPEGFARWWDGGGILHARKLFQSIAPELEEVEVEGCQAFALRTTLEAMRRSQPAGTVRLLPLFDAYLMGIGRDAEAILPQAYQRLVFRPQGWISAVVLADGVVQGVWETKPRGGQTLVTVRPFSSLPEATRHGIQAEAQRLGAYLNRNVEVEYE